MGIVNAPIFRGLALACALSFAADGLAGTPQAAGTGSASVVVRNDGTVWQWGTPYGAAASYRPAPVLIEGSLTPLQGMTMVAGGTGHFLATGTYALYVWGFNGNGELGKGDTASAPRPIGMSYSAVCGSFTYILSVAAGNNHSLVLCSDGTVRSFGYNGAGALGTGGTSGAVTTPQTVVGVGGVGTLVNVVAIAAAAGSSFAVRGDGTVVAWGHNNNGQLGDGSTTARLAPVVVKNVGGTGQLTGVTHIATGWNHVLARRSDGSVVAWGDNASGQLGVGSTAGPFTSPVAVLGVGGIGTLSGIRSVHAGAFAGSYAITNGGRLLSWGGNLVGTVGDGTTATRTTPVDIGLSGVVAVGANGTNCTNCSQHVVAVTSYGLTYSWGANNSGELGIGQAFSGARFTPGLVVSDDPAVPFFAKAGTDAQQPRGDINGDLQSDVTWVEPSSGGLYQWAMNGKASFPRNLGNVGGGWTLAGIGDFDFDGFADLLWRHTDGSMYVWFMDGPDIRAQGFLPWADPSWSVLAVNDFTGDGAADILLRRSPDGALVIWQMAGLSLARTINAGTLDPAVWSLAATGDLNGDGMADFLWRDTTGNMYAWINAAPLSSTNTLNLSDQGALPNPGLEWSVVAAADMDGDGKADILFRRTTDGANYLWRMNGKAIASQAALPAVGTEWSVALVGDFNGDGRNDVLFRRTDGANYVWLMNDTAIIDQGSLPAVGTTWSVVKHK